MFEKGILLDKTDSKQVSNAIRWFKRNIKTGSSFVCIKKGVYEMSLTELEAAYTSHKTKRKKITEKKQEVMKKVNQNKKNNPQKNAGSGGETP
jgi:hypothetical protein